MAALDNIQVVVPSTPAQYFHVLRRQVHRDLAKPLVVMTPKSLLRTPAARSRTEEFTGGSFKEVLRDPAGPDKAEKVVLCQGKFYYDLLAGREAKDVEGVALVRLEQPYPFPAETLQAELSRFEGAKFVWAQEEPENMGSWRHVEHRCRTELGLDLQGISRPESASPATGSLRVHRSEQEELVERVLSA